MTRWEWVVKVLSESAKEEIPRVYKLWLFENVVRKNIRVCVEECVCNELEWTNKFTHKGIFFVQDENVHLGKDFVDTSKSALVLVPYFYDVKNPCYLVYWYNPNIEVSKNTSKAQKVAYKVRHFNLPTFEEWRQKNNEVEIVLGAYCVRIAKFSWNHSSVEYIFAMSLANRNPLNVYTDKLFNGKFEYKYEDDISELKRWYDSTVATFYDFWEQYINSLYLEPDV